MKVDIDRFGIKNVDVDPNTLFSFPAGILGFESCKSFKLFHEEGKKHLYWLQSVEDAAITFPIVTPDVLNLEYQIELSTEDCELIGLSDTNDIAVVVIVYRPEGADEKISANMCSPVILNMKNRKGMQKTLKEVEQKLLYLAR